MTQKHNPPRVVKCDHCGKLTKHNPVAWQQLCDKCEEKFDRRRAYKNGYE